MGEQIRAIALPDHDTAACEHCGCTWDRACVVSDALTGEPRGCAWAPAFWAAGRAVCECCVHLVTPLERG
jgi:hypothetical protein